MIGDITPPTDRVVIDEVGGLTSYAPLSSTAAAGTSHYYVTRKRRGATGRAVTPAGQQGTFAFALETP